MSTPKVIYDYDPRNLPRKLVAAIGRLIAAGSQTEASINFAIMGCLGLDSEYGMAVTTHMTLPLKFHVLKAAAEIRLATPESLDELDIILTEIEEALGKRHDAAHDQWCIHPDTRDAYRAKIRARGSVQGDLIPVDIKSVEADAAAVHLVGMKLLNFILNHDLVPQVAPMRPRGHKTKAARKKRRKTGLEK